MSVKSTDKVKKQTMVMTTVMVVFVFVTSMLLVIIYAKVSKTRVAGSCTRTMFSVSMITSMIAVPTTFMMTSSMMMMLTFMLTFFGFQVSLAKSSNS